MVINKAELKRLMLEASVRYRNGKFTRVGNDVFEHFDQLVQAQIINFVRAHPTIGKTLKTGKSDQVEEVV